MTKPKRILSTYRDEEGKKWCGGGKHMGFPKEFGRNKSNPDGLADTCLRCSALRKKLSREAWASEQHKTMLKSPWKEHKPEKLEKCPENTREEPPAYRWDCVRREGCLDAAAVDNHCIMCRGCNFYRVRPRESSYGLQSSFGG